MTGRIVFDQVWKRFRRGPAHDSLRDLIPAAIRSLTGRQTRQEEVGDNGFWAVRDVSFEVKPGEALGIIGGNGAGKSTTLKLLTRILHPTQGTALVEGRVGSLIEVSAGFHPDLTGRENVFLQGAIMGMPQRLIRERFDEIVEFSGISAFIDTPVKRYSSGMNARLGFSIAVHLEPDVLIIDEVLSVGDAEFQGRAFDQIRQLTRSNIPVVIVSHQLDRIVELCTRTILLRAGGVAFDGSPSSAVAAYMTSHSQHEEAETGSIGPAPSRFTSVELLTPGTVTSGDYTTVRFTLDTIMVTSPEQFKCEFNLYNLNTNAWVYHSHLGALGRTPMRPGASTIDVRLQMNVPPGLYRLETKTWDLVQSVAVATGPSLILSVTSTEEQVGTHQLNAIALGD